MEEASRSAGGLRRHWAIGLVVAAFAALFFPFTWSGHLASLGGDSPTYILTARHYTPFVALDPIAEWAAGESQFPPLYPLLLALTGSAFDLHFAHAVTTLCLLVAMVLAYLWMTRIGVERGLAAAAIAVFGAMPGTAHHVLQLHSENLYLALVSGLLAVLALQPRPSSLALAAGLGAAAVLTRSAGIVLCVPLLVWAWRARASAWQFALVPLGMLLPALVWSLFHQPEHSYSTNLALHYSGMSPTDLIGQWMSQAVVLADGVVVNVLQTPTFVIPVLVLELFALVVMAWRMTRGHPDGWYVAAYVALIVAWPYPAEARRFAWLLLLPMLAYLLVAAQAIASRVPAFQRSIAALPVLVLALVVAPSSLSIMSRYNHPLAQAQPEMRALPEFYDPELVRAIASSRRHLDLADAFRFLVAKVPPGECLFSIKPRLASFYGDRVSFGTPFEQLDDEAFWSEIRNKGCRYFLLSGRTSTYSELYYPLGRIPERLVVTDKRFAGPRLIAALAVLRPGRPEQPAVD